MTRKLFPFLLAVLFFPSLAFAGRPGLQCMSATPTLDTSAYATGDLMGGKLTFTGAFQQTAGSGVLMSVRIADKAGVSSDMDLVLFESDPSNTTFTDQAALDVDDADLTKILTVVNFGSSSRFAFNDNGVKLATNQAQAVVGRVGSTAIGTTLYGALVSRGTPTFASASDVTVTLCIVRD